MSPAAVFSRHSMSTAAALRSHVVMSLAVPSPAEVAAVSASLGRVSIYNSCLMLAAVCRMADVAYTAMAAQPVSPSMVAVRLEDGSELPVPGALFTMTLSQLVQSQWRCPGMDDILSPASTTTTTNYGNKITLCGGAKLLSGGPLFSYSTHHFPGGLFRLVESLTYPTPSGLKILTRAGVEATLRQAERLWVMDLLPTPLNAGDTTAASPTADSAGSGEAAAAASVISRAGDAQAQIDAARRELAAISCTTMDEARFAFLAMCDLIIERKCFYADGTLTGLAKRDLKKNCGPSASMSGSDSTSAAVAAPAASAKGSASASPGGATSGSAAVEVEKNTKGILLTKCESLWPYVPPDKAFTTVIENDPTAPRHKQRFKATVTLVAMKGKQTSFTGDWCATKRDAEMSACSAALVFLSTQKK